MSLLQEVGEILDQFFGDEPLTSYTATCELLIGACGVMLSTDGAAPPSPAS